MRHLRSLGLVPETGLEPVRLITRPRILSPLRLPFHHSGSSRSLSNRAPRGNAPQFASRYILTALSYLVLVCLPTCGHGSGNGTPCAGRAICASFAPLGVYIYAVGGESCRNRLTLEGSARLRPETKPRLAPSGVRRGARGLGLPPAPCAAAPVVFAAIRAAMLRRWIHLLALRRVSPRIRRTASPHVAQFGTRPLVPCLTFHKARFSSQHLRSPPFRQLA